VAVRALEDEVVVEAVVVSEVLVLRVAPAVLVVVGALEVGAAVSISYVFYAFYNSVAEAAEVAEFAL
jgi:hypothetical protein